LRAAQLSIKKYLESQQVECSDLDDACFNR
jgi:hypothetical protein